VKNRGLLIFFIIVCQQLYAAVNADVQKLGTFAKKNSRAFEENKGQVLGPDAAKVKFKYKPQSDITIFITNTSLIYQFEKWHFPLLSDSMNLIIKKGEDIEAMDQYMKDTRIETYRMDMELIGANPNPQVIVEDKSNDYINYYNHDALGVHFYQKITFKNIYHNIDWVIYTANHRQTNSLSSGEGRGEVKYDFIVHPGGNPYLIQWKTKWVEDLKLDKEGNLILKNLMGTIQENSPISFQGDKAIKSKFILQSNTISYVLDQYDTTQTLVIDPSIGWVTYYGGYVPSNSQSGSTTFNSTSIDKLGNVYGAGSSIDFPNISAGGHQNSNGGLIDAVLVKFDNDGFRLWATYYGGANGDRANSCICDKDNNVYIGGSTGSPSGISFNGFQNSRIGSGGGMLVKFNSQGIRQWGTYFGTTGTIISCLAYDPNDNIYGSGYKTIADVTTHNLTHNGQQSNYGGGVYDAFLFKFSIGGSRIWATYYGDTGADISHSCAADAYGNIYIVGRTSSGKNIAYNGHQNQLGGFGIRATYPGYMSNLWESFIAKFDKDGVRQWASYYGDTAFADWAWGCAVDKFNNVYMSGVTHSNRAIATPGSHCDFNNHTIKNYLVKFNPSGNRKWATYYGDNSTSADYFQNIYYEYSQPKCGVDDSNFVYLYGSLFDSAMTNIASNGFQNTYTGHRPENYFVKFDSMGIRQWGSYFGGIGDEFVPALGNNLSFDKRGNCFFSGITDSAAVYAPLISRNLAYKGFQSAYSETFLGKICNRLDSPSIVIAANRPNPICEGSGLNFTTAVGREGSFPVYEWKVNRQAVGTNKSSIYLTNLKNNDTVECRLQSSATCLYFDTVWSTKYIVQARKADTLVIRDTICELQTYWFDNKNLTASGTYIDTLMSSAGCDSFVFLHLFVKDTSRYVFSHITPCDPNASFMFNGLARTQSGTYSAKYLNIVGCDSTAVLNLTVRKPSTPFSFTRYICPGASYLFNGVPRTLANTYTQVLTNAQGCDSSVTLDLRVLNSPRLEQNPIPACAPFTFRGMTYTSSATVIDTIKSTVGNCDSVYLSNLIQLKPPATTIPDTNFIVCDSFRLNNRLFTNSFSFIDTFRTQGAVQCDSIYRKTNYIIRSTPQIGLKERDTFMRGSQVTLKPFSATNYLWSTGQTTKDISFKLTEDRQLYLIAWNEEPCRDTAYISLVAEDLAIVGMPTGFSPTGEHAENRTLRPNINGRLEYFHMMVFNRWGEKVYETFDTQPLGWNGIFKGELAPSGLYGYVMEYRTLGIIYHKSGEVMLVR
jgi:hypothetical protein